MKNTLLIVFVKNKKLGTVKTRLAKVIGDKLAFELYEALLDITEKAVTGVDRDKVVYFSQSIEDTHWKNCKKKLQHGAHLGARMHQAFLDGFALGYESIVLIGSDLPEISKEIIEKGFHELEENDVVIGPAQDGGYYLIGMNQPHAQLFEDKPWSQPNLLEVTLEQVKAQKLCLALLEPLNDIDTYDDLIASDFFINNTELQHKINPIHD